MNLTVDTPIEGSFLSSPSAERVTLIRHGVALRLSDLKNRLFLAESKVRALEAKYNMSLARLDAEGLHDDASVEMHENYIMWHHWADAAKQPGKSSNLSSAKRSCCLSTAPHVGSVRRPAMARRHGSAATC